MKNVFTFRIGFTLMAALLLAFGPLQAQTIVTDSATMGPSYANDVYYSLDQGTVASPEAGNYDIAFFTTVWSAGIITNDGRGVMLWAYPKADTSGWNTIDTTGLSTWTPLYNSIESWEEGAFNRNSRNHPDYGWGVYNTITHDVEGDSLFVIKTRSGMYKKIWIERKISVTNTYLFRFADLDGNNLKEVTFNCTPLVSKNFAAYDLEQNQPVDREPASDTWDLLFTKYIGLYGGTTPYPVTGVLNNINSVANRFSPVSPDYTNWGASPFSKNKEVIGWDWKTFDMATFSYIIADSLIFFDSTNTGSIHRLWFTGFAGSSSGKFYFNHELISGTGLAEPKKTDMMIWPNPASEFINIETSIAGSLTISDQLGRMVFRTPITTAGTTRIALPMLTSGLYLWQLRNGTQIQSGKLIIQ